jgi:hypothetical protein
MYGSTGVLEIVLITSTRNILVRTLSCTEYDCTIYSTLCTDDRLDVHTVSVNKARTMAVATQTTDFWEHTSSTVQYHTNRHKSMSSFTLARTTCRSVSSYCWEQVISYAIHCTGTIVPRASTHWASTFIHNKHIYASPCV